MFGQKPLPTLLACIALLLTGCAGEQIQPVRGAVVVYPQIQTEPVMTLDDAADDPAVWVNEADSALSRVIGTDKRFGLEVYNLSGQRLQRIPVGRLNNIDLRAVNDMDGWSSIAAASNRTNNSISLFLINNTGEVVWLKNSEIITGLAEPYGLCMYSSEKGLQVFVNDTDGSYQQWLLLAAPAQAGLPQFGAQLLRQFSVSSQPEGCVADDEQRLLFLGVEDEGIRVMMADSEQSAAINTVADIDGEILAADVEGMDLYLGNASAGYLVASSQGNNSYAVYDRQAPHPYRGSFIIVDNTQLNVDGTQDTDGIAISSRLRTEQFPEGILVVQDGNNTSPQATQNFKYVSWQQISQALQLQK